MKYLKWLGVGTIVSSLCLLLSSIDSEAGVSVNTAGKTHIGTFEGSTTFTTSSSNGINPGLFIEVRDADGNFKQYTSEDGVITVPNTKEGAYVTQAKFLGKTKYVDQDTGEVLDEWEEGRNLKLESVKMPVLTTNGSNLIPPFTEWSLLSGSISDYSITDKRVEISLSRWNMGVSITKQLKPNTTYTVGWDEASMVTFNFSGTDKSGDMPPFRTFTTGNTGIVKFALKNSTSSGTFIIDGFRISEGNSDLGYRPYKSNILTVNEDIELHGIGEVKDELNLLTGELTQRIGEVVLDGSEDETWNNTLGNYYVDQETKAMCLPKSFIELPVVNTGKTNIMVNNFKVLNTGYTNGQGYGVMAISTHDTWHIQFVKQGVKTVEKWREFLQSNPIKIKYQLTTESVKTVDLTSTHQFDLISDSVVQIKGEALPTIYSITVPSEPLTFAINPNAEEGQQFVAPDFSITNESKGPVFLELKSFEQTTTVFNDVLPDEHDDWVQLTKEESKDIALALVPKLSDSWLTLNEGSPEWK